VTYVLSVDDLTPKSLAQSVYLNVALPAGVSLLTTYADRGSGCTVLSATPAQVLPRLSFRPGAARERPDHGEGDCGRHSVLVATVTAQQSESSLANNVDAHVHLQLDVDAGGSSRPQRRRTPTGEQDKKKPTARALLTWPSAEPVAKLRFKIYDDHGIAKAITTVRPRPRPSSAGASTGYGPVVAGSVYYVGWRVPAKAAKGDVTPSASRPSTVRGTERTVVRAGRAQVTP